MLQGGVSRHSSITHICLLDFWRGPSPYHQQPLCLSNKSWGQVDILPLAVGLQASQQLQTFKNSTSKFLDLATNHSIVINISRRHQWTPHLSHLDKYRGGYAYLNLCSPRSHWCPRRCPRTTSHSKCHISYLTPPIEVLLSILESRRHKLLIACGLTLMTLSPRSWEVF